MDEAIKTGADSGNEPEPPKIRRWAYYADIAKWIIGTIGVIIDHIKTNPFPKRNDYQTV